MKHLATSLATLLSCVVFCTTSVASKEPETKTELPRDQNILKVGTKAPNFTRFTSGGTQISLKDFRGKLPVILYFYPKDETPNCIKEACGFRDFYKEVQGKGAAVIGISGDSDQAHLAFSSHYSLPFHLISDTDNSLLRLYHVPFYKTGLHKRITFVIDKSGTITDVVQDSNDGNVHVQQALKALDAIKEH